MIELVARILAYSEMAFIRLTDRIDEIVDELEEKRERRNNP